MKKANIIKKNLEFQNIINKSKCYKYLYFQIYVAKTNLGYSRYGIGVSRKVKTAVKRNKLKRQVKAVINTNQLYKISLDYVIIVKSNAVALNFKTLESNLLQALKITVKKETNNEKPI